MENENLTVDPKEYESRIMELEFLSDSFEQAPFGMKHISGDGKFMRVNKKFCDITGYDRHELLMKRVDDITYINDIRGDAPLLYKLLSGELLNYDFEKRIVRKDGKIIWVHLTRTLIKSFRNNQIIFSTIEDINVRKKDEEKLRQSLTNYQTLAENSPEIIVRFDKDLNMLYTNRSIKKISGKKPFDLIGKNLKDFAPGERYSDWVVRFEKVSAAKKKLYFTDNIETIKGERTIETIFVPEFDANDNVNSFLTISRDTTEEKKAQEEIYRRKILLEKILENIPIGIWVIDESGNLLLNNKASEIIWCGKENLSMIKNPDFKAWDAETGEKIQDKEWACYRAYYYGETCLGKIINIKDTDGGIKNIMNSAVPMFNKENKIMGVVAITEDITQVVKTENELRKSLSEKELLMKEINHRIKNNFQIMASLFNLQRNSLKNKNIEDILIESQNRITSMAILHEKLYKSRNLNSINFAEYLSELTKSFINSYYTEEKNISFKLDLDELIVSTDMGLYLGLIVNELISNSLKYAFRNVRDGIISIILESADNNICLIVKDNGIGIDMNIDISNTDSLGMLVVSSFVNQLKGTLVLNRSNGTEFKMVFPHPEISR